MDSPVRFPVIAVALALVSCTQLRSGPPARSGASDGSGTGSPVSLASPADPASRVASPEFTRRLLSQVAPSGQDRDFVLGPGDLVEVSVFDVPELSGLKLRVPLGGHIALPLIGDVAAAGLTSTELQEVVRARLQHDYMHDPQVSVFVVEPKSQRVSVGGAVRAGGVFTMTNRLRLTDALAMAGGLGEDAGHTVYVIRRVPGELGTRLAAARTGEVTDAAPTGGSVRQIMTAVDLDALVEGRGELNLPLRADDVINVPRAGTYYVGGDVEHAGSFPLKGRLTVAQAIVAAGGVKDTADWTDVRLYRNRAGRTREISTYDLNEVEQGKPTPEIQADDVVIVGRSGVKSFLYGARDFFRFGLGAAIPIP